MSPAHRNVPDAIEPRAHAVDIVDGRIVLGGEMGANVVAPDIDAANGVIHVIDAVLLER